MRNQLQNSNQTEGRSVLKECKKIAITDTSDMYLHAFFRSKRLSDWCVLSARTPPCEFRACDSASCSKGMIVVREGGAFVRALHMFKFHGMCAVCM